jgi:hypothetical protein
MALMTMKQSRLECQGAIRSPQSVSILTPPPTPPVSTVPPRPETVDRSAQDHAMACPDGPSPVRSTMVGLARRPRKLPSTTPGIPCHVCGFSYSNRCTYMSQDAITTTLVGHDSRTRPTQFAKYTKDIKHKKNGNLGRGPSESNHGWSRTAPRGSSMVDPPGESPSHEESKVVRLQNHIEKHLTLT